MKFAALLLSSACAFAQLPGRLTLPEAEAIAIKNHPSLSAALLNAQAAGQVPTEVGAARFPTVAANITGAGAADGSRLAAGLLNNPSVYNRAAAGVNISQVITDFGRTSNLVEQARLRAAGQQDAAEATRAQILLQVNRAYFAALRSQNVLTVARQTVAARQVVVDQVSALADAKLKSGLDLSFARVNLSDARLLLSTAENQAQAAMAELSESLGLPRSENFQLEDPPAPGPLIPDVQALIAEALHNRPDAAQMRLEQSAAQRFVQAERALSYPTVSAVAGAGFVPGREDVAQLRSLDGAFGLNLSLLVFNGHLFQARRREAEFRAQAASKNVQAYEDRIARDVQVAWLNANTARERMSLSDEMLQQASQALELAQSRYDLGLSSIVELTQAQLNKTSAEIASAASRYDYQSERAVLSYQLGNLK